ncbi:phage portal protein [Brevibacterium moorei]|uniref:phage portal protein n=1 Tax=Brevibacterium moorei TaxID=2968457 RepID=UPI00211B7AAA|nr:phage portal protein [Brevibacterium sp. 68QC2CO]MCQ9385125.1 phage portal protein [Brevibacterium sp. 68QC2CO]
MADTALEEEVESSLVEDLDDLFTSLLREREITTVCDDYINGDQEDPWSPDELDQEYAELKERAKVNVIRLPPLVASEVSSVAGYRRVKDYDEDGNEISERFPQEFKDFRRLRLSNLQNVVHHASATYGQAFVEVYKDGSKPGANVLSSLNTTALWDNAVSDEHPRSALTVIRRPSDGNGKKVIHGLAYGWDRTTKYRLVTDDEGRWVVAASGPHGFSDTPVTRFPCFLDSEGRVSGLVENLIEPQDRINQTVLDLLTGQAYTGNQIYTIAGVRGEQVIDYDGQPKVDSDGNPVYKPFRMSARRVLTSEQPDTKFDRIQAGSLEDLLAALGSSLQMFAIAGQQSPYLYNGNISNLAAETIAALDSQFFRLIEFLHRQWGESWASIFRLFAEANGDQEGATAWDVEVRWEDYSIKTFSAYADGLAKVADSLQIPAEGLWHMVPDVSSSTIEYWRSLKARADDYAFDAEGDDEFERQLDLSRNPQPTPEVVDVRARS